MIKLHKVEKRILELKDELAEAKSPYKSIVFVRGGREELESALERLTTERQFILDRRNNLFWRLIWNVVVPVVVATITAYLISVFSK